MFFFFSWVFDQTVLIIQVFPPGFLQAQRTGTNSSRMASIPAGGSLVATTDYYRSESLLFFYSHVAKLSSCPFGRDLLLLYCWVDTLVP